MLLDRVKLEKECKKKKTGHKPGDSVCSSQTRGTPALNRNVPPFCVRSPRGERAGPGCQRPTAKTAFCDESRNAAAPAPKRSVLSLRLSLSARCLCRRFFIFNVVALMPLAPSRLINWDFYLTFAGKLRSPPAAVLYLSASGSDADTAASSGALA